jgi:hypothetical protein
MRYNPADTDAPAQYCIGHPPRENSRWITDEAGVLFDLFQHDTTRIIEARALADPENYAAVGNDNASLDDVDRAIAAVAAEIEGRQ